MKKLNNINEDLLETIYSYSLEKKRIRLTDVARKMEVSKSRISQEVKKLKEINLIKKDSYSSLKLTLKGKEKGRKIFFKHNLIKKYLKSILNISEYSAEKDACNIEHIITEETLENIFLELKKNKKIEYDKCKKNIMFKTKKQFLEIKPLNEIKIKQKAKILKIKKLKKNKIFFMERGIVKGETIELIRRGPFGDPLEFKINNYNFFLRVKEVNKIIVKIIKEL